MWTTLDEIRDANKAAGHFFFHPDTMKALDSRLYPAVFGGRFFITSELDVEGVRRWHVRMARPDARILRMDDASAGDGYADYAGARARAEELSVGLEGEAD